MNTSRSFIREGQQLKGVEIDGQSSNTYGSFGLLVCALLAILAIGCVSIPRDFDAPPDSIALEPAMTGPLAKFASMSPHVADAADSSWMLLDMGEEALLWRLALIDSAETSLDLQYYIWHDDNSGRLLLYRIYQAADRGVRVRLLVDDLYLRGRDPVAVAIDRHPNIEIRVFNPWRQRRFGFILEFMSRLRLNHRMHNKLLVADGVAAIVGGRNIGDEYFGMSDHANFLDMDVLSVGQVAIDLASTFDHYWNSDWIVPAAEFDRALDDEDPREQLRDLAERIRSEWPIDSVGLERQDWGSTFTTTASIMRPGTSTIYFDKLSGDSVDTSALDGLRDLLLEAEEEILIANAYLVVDDEFIEGVRRATNDGIRVLLLTNSLASNNQTLVHAGYKTTRKDLLKAGAELYEFRHDAAIQSDIVVPPIQASSVGLHHKVAVVDRRRVVLGSFNADPRSMFLNTELVVIVESAELAEELAALILRDTNPDNAWRVSLNDEQRLNWSSSAGELIRDPAKSFYQRVISFVAGFLPIRKQL